MRLPDLGKHLHNQIVIPLMAASLAVAIVATFVGVWEMDTVIGKWIDANIESTMRSVDLHFATSRASLEASAKLLAEDERLIGLLARRRTLKGSVHDPVDDEVRSLLVEVRPALGVDHVMLLDRDGAVIASNGFPVSPPVGSRPIGPEYLRWANLGMNFTTLVAIEGSETVTTLQRVRVSQDLGDIGEYTLVVSRVIDEGFLRSDFSGLGGAFAYFDAKGKPVALYVDRGATGGGELAARLARSGPEVAAALAKEGTGYLDLRMPDSGQTYRLLSRRVAFTDPTDPTGARGHLLAAVNTDVQTQVGTATMRLIAFWSVLAVALLTAFGFVVARRISVPLVTLSKSARLVADGDFTQKVKVGGRNEIGAVAESFNMMTESLRQRTEGVTKKVLELATLYEMSRALGSTLELDTLLESVLDSALRIFDVSSGYVMLRDSDTERLELRAWRGMADIRPDETAVRSSMCEWVAREGRPLLFNPSADSAQGGQTDAVTGATAALCVPLVSSDGVIGALTVGSRDPSFRFTSDDVRLLSTIANHATIAIGNIELFSSLQDAYIATVRSLAAAVDAKDPFTRGHSDRVASYAMAIAERLDLSPDQRTALEMAAYLHDIGKIGVDGRILLKPGPLDDEEMAQMRHHPLIGANILKPVAFPWAIAPVVRHHHEHWDGNGYPAGLRGEEIPLLARILTLADAYEAMTSDRPYRSGRSKDEAVGEILRCSGTHFDPRLAEIFVGVLRAEAEQAESADEATAVDIQPDEARAIFVAVCDGMLGSFRRLGGPRLASNLETDLNRHFVDEGLPLSFSAGKLTARWDGGGGRRGETEAMRGVVARIAAAMERTSGSSLVDTFYHDALGDLSDRMRRLALVMDLHGTS